MATLLELNKANALYKIDAGLEAGQQEFRLFFASPQLAKWMDKVLPNLVSRWQIELSPLEQLDALLEI